MGGEGYRSRRSRYGRRFFVLRSQTRKNRDKFIADITIPGGEDTKGRGSTCRNGWAQTSGNKSVRHFCEREGGPRRFKAAALPVPHGRRSLILNLCMILGSQVRVLAEICSANVAKSVRVTADESERGSHMTSTVRPSLSRLSHPLEHLEPRCHRVWLSLAHSIFIADAFHHSSGRGPRCFITRRSRIAFLSFDPTYY